MQQNLEQLLQQIEELRKELNLMGIKRGLKDPEVYKKSAILDKLIVEYYNRCS